MKSKITAYDWFKNISESNLGLNTKVKKKFDKVDAVDSISEYVDLGLPSGIQWRKYNLGSYSDNEIGDFFNYKEVNELANKNSKVVVPSKENFRELKKYCEVQEFSDGIKYTSKVNQKSIMFKHTGYVQNGEFLLGPTRPCGLWWSFSKTKYKVAPPLSLRPANKRSTIVFSVFEANGYDYDANKFCVRPILLPDSLYTNESSLGLNKKIQKKYSERTVEDVADEMFSSSEFFRKELIEFAKKKCKIKCVEVDDHLGEDDDDRIDVMFDFLTGEQVYFIFALDKSERYSKYGYERLAGHFGILLNNSEEGESWATYLPIKSAEPSEVTEIVGEYDYDFSMLRTMYKICPETLKDAKEFLLECSNLIKNGEKICPEY